MKDTDADAVLDPVLWLEQLALQRLDEAADTGGWALYWPLLN